MASTEQEQMFITCEVCDVAFTSITTFEQHVKGKKHKKRQMQVDDDACIDESKNSKEQDFTCGLCETTFSGIIPYSQHLKSNHHAKVIRRKKAEDDIALLENADSDSEMLDEDIANLKEMAEKMLPEPYGSCDICDKQFCGPESYSQHMKSKYHAKRKHELQLLKKIRAILGISGVSDSEEICEDKEEKGLPATGEEEELKCKECDKAFSSSVSFAQHLLSRAHKKRENQNKLLEDLKAIGNMQLEDDSSSSEDEESSEILTCEICKLVFTGPENFKAHINGKNHQKVVKFKKYLAKRGKSTGECSKAHESFDNKANPEKPSTEKQIGDPEKSESSTEVVKGE